ncbi:hypothetical protein TNCV_5034471 [Trichonephila clavipes]|nr:hypothetical protein TNCV_5034471 [Trichonephila clavipes]
MQFQTPSCWIKLNPDLTYAPFETFVTAIPSEERFPDLSPDIFLSVFMLLTPIGLCSFVNPTPLAHADTPRDILLGRNITSVGRLTGIWS